MSKVYAPKSFPKFIVNVTLSPGFTVVLSTSKVIESSGAACTFPISIDENNNVSIIIMLNIFSISFPP